MQFNWSLLLLMKRMVSVLCINREMSSVITLNFMRGQYNSLKILNVLQMYLLSRKYKRHLLFSLSVTLL